MRKFFFKYNSYPVTFCLCLCLPKFLTISVLRQAAVAAHHAATFGYDRPLEPLIQDILVCAVCSPCSQQQYLIFPLPSQTLAKFHEAAAGRVTSDRPSQVQGWRRKRRWGMKQLGMKQVGSNIMQYCFRNI